MGSADPDGAVADRTLERGKTSGERSEEKMMSMFGRRNNGYESQVRCAVADDDGGHEGMMPPKVKSEVRATVTPTYGSLPQRGVDGALTAVSPIGRECCWREWNSARGQKRQRGAVGVQMSGCLD
jgi:hypothetical protein